MIKEDLQLDFDTADFWLHLDFETFDIDMTIKNLILGEFSMWIFSDHVV